jgi:cellulose synthase/poly-beta-1,6-N-acetylglucosamine synthase-like glycosyltransferase
VGKPIQSIQNTMKEIPKVSIIIPVRAVNDYVRESIPKILELDYLCYEIIIITDHKDTKHHWDKTKLLTSGPNGPAVKRDIGAKEATGEILAFLDDDAYPRPDWLKKSIHCFVEDDKVGAVGGPAITPSDDGVLQKVSGAVFESYLGGGSARNRYMCIGDHCLCEDWPTVNFLVRKDVFAKVGGFDTAYWPGEDTKLCLDIINAGYLIKYDPEAIVYHHRRGDLMKHLKQTGNYALHRGHFAKIYPKTSLKLFYFAPTFFCLYLLTLVVIFSLIGESADTIRLILLAPLLIYVAGLIIDGIIISVRWRNPFVGLLAIPMVLLTHLWYGVRFVYGLVLPKLDS